MQHQQPPWLNQPVIFAQSVDCAGWVLHEAWLDVMHWTLHNSNSPHAHHTEQAHGGPMLSENGVRVYLRIVRASRQAALRFFQKPVFLALDLPHQSAGRKCEH